MDELTIAALIKLIETEKMPQWWTTYASQIAYNLQVHTKGLMFDKITGLYPNEHPDSQKHCINSYESITKGSVWKAINNIVRVFNNSSYNIFISDKTRLLIEKFQETDGSLFSQFLEDWIKNAVTEDPNGICVVYPPEYENEFYRYVNHKDIIKISDDVLIFISEEESEKKYEFIDQQYNKELFTDYTYVNEGQPNYRHLLVKTYNRRLETKYINKVFHVFTQTHFIRFYKEDPVANEYQYDYYPINHYGALPYFENGGIEVEKEIYESFLQAFVPFGNKALLADRNKRAVDLMFSYPKMSEVQQACDTCNGRGETECAAGWETCRTCNGSKYLTPQSPYKVYRKVQDSFDTDNKVFSTPSVEYYSPDPAILTYGSKEVDSYLQKAEDSVFVQQKQNTGSVQAAKSKQLDQEGLFAWLSNISKVLFNNLEMFLQYLENYTNKTPVKASVERPYSFAILTESEAFDSMTLILTSNAPVLIKASQIDSFINKFISDNSPVKRAMQILKKYDLLLYYSSDDVASLKGQGVVNTKMVMQHTLAYPVLIQMYETNKKIFDLEDEAIINKLSIEVDKYDLTKDLKTNLLTAIPAAVA